MAGIVIAKGDGASKFEIGDEVYGNIQDFNASGKHLKQLGTLAEYVAVEQSLVALKPPNHSFEEAASLPLALQTAVQGFETAEFEEEGRSIFVVGGSGGVGSLVVQLAKRVYGASHVAATTSTPKVDFVKGLGASHVVATTCTPKDINENKGDTKNSFIVAKEEAPIIDITWPPSHPRAVYSSLTVRGNVLEKLRPYLESGELKAIIDPTGPYHFKDVVEAFGHLETGRARGKVVISPLPSSPWLRPCLLPRDNPHVTTATVVQEAAIC
ncbi:hypothetical protein ACLOJK_005289 [Asimina triloba]